MEIVVVERSFEEPVDLETLVAKEAGAGWCLEMYGVEFLKSYVATDARRMICLYQAPDAEAVRTAQSTAGMPFDRVWSCSLFDPNGLGA
jgi:hypothetical protein